MLKPDGLFFFTCASTGRAEHGIKRTNPQDSYGTIGNLKDMSDYYKNLSENDLNEILPLNNLFSVWDTYYNYDSKDLYFVGIKKGNIKFGILEKYLDNLSINHQGTTGISHTNYLNATQPIALKINKNKSKKIVDFFPYYDTNGKELLELRINMLKDYVDEFVICESNKTQSGIPIEYNLRKRIDELKLPKEKIRIIELKIPEDDDLIIEDIDRYNCSENYNCTLDNINEKNSNSLKGRVRERMQKDSLLLVLDEYSDDTVFIHSDSDEIINPKSIEWIASVCKQHENSIIKIPLVHLEGRADLRVYLKNENAPKHWNGGMFFATKNHLKISSPTQIRSLVFNRFKIEHLVQDGEIIQDMGWHFSWMGDRVKKSKAFCHYDDNFEFLINGNIYCEKSQKILLDEPQEGKVPPSGFKNTILKKYPIENLPSEIFKLPRVMEFLLPTNINIKDYYNLCQFALQNGGMINFLTLPSIETKGLGQTNPSIIYKEGIYLLNLRHVQYALYHSEGEQKYQTIWGPLSYLHPEDDNTLTTTNYLCQLNPNTLVIDKFNKVNTSKLDKTPVWEFVGLEDARIVYWENYLYLSGVRRDTKPNGEGRMELSKIEKESETERYRIEPPVYSKSDGTSYCEKNWMPILDMPFHYVKWTNPTEVVRVNHKKGTSETIHLVNQNVQFPRDIRGGSQVITFGDYYVALTHEVDLWNNIQGNKDAQYYHRFIIWDKEWNIVHYSPEFKFMTGRIEFSCGLAFDGNNFIIPFGFQDSTAFVLKLPLAAFNDLCGIKQEKKEKKKKNKLTPELLEKFVNNPYDAIASFEMGSYYFNQGHFASSLSFFLRTAEYSKDDSIIYDSLLMVAKSLSSLGKRKTTELGLWQNALALDPSNPIAYLHLSEYHENMKNYHQSYSYAVMGLQLTNTLTPILTAQLLFQKAVSLWWIGRVKESKEIFLFLSDNSKLPEKYQELIQYNILKC